MRWGRARRATSPAAPGNQYQQRKSNRRGLRRVHLNNIRPVIVGGVARYLVIWSNHHLITTIHADTAYTHIIIMILKSRAMLSSVIRAGVIYKKNIYIAFYERIVYYIAHIGFILKFTSERRNTRDYSMKFPQDVFFYTRKKR